MKEKKSTGRHKFALTLPSTVLVLGERTLVMGVLNVTPDSFSDGGLYFDPDRAAAHALEMQHAGADLIDIGGESARPGAAGVSAQVELERLLPVLKRLRRRVRVPISVDTTKAEVAEAAIQAGAQMINDVSGLRADARLARVAQRHGVPLVLMHSRGTPRTMQQLPAVANIWREVEKGLTWSVRQAQKVGLRRTQLVIDPGIGFGKTAVQNYEILRGLERLERFKLPVLIGTSRKSFIGKVLDAPADARLLGTAATVAASILGGAHIVRVHDVDAMVQVVRVTDAILRAGSGRAG